MFIGREKELETLNRYYLEPGFQMFILYGRRRIGKTTLLREFLKGKDNAVYYTAAETSPKENLKGLSAQILASQGKAEISFSGYDAAFHYLGECAKDRRILLILDEYPYLVKQDHGISTLLQRVIDEEWKDRNICLILCGSSISFMEEEVLGSRSPLYGRRTGQLKLGPLSYRKTREFLPDYTPEEWICVYAMTGGVPKYLEMFRSDRSLSENAKAGFFSPDGYFYEEPENLLKQEISKISLYNAIIGAIAHGAAKAGEIASTAGVENSVCVQALKKLQDIDIVHKRFPLTEPHNRKQTQYVLADNMFRFWYGCVQKALSTISAGYGDAYYARIVEPALHQFAAPIFEEICREFAFEQGMKGEIPAFFTEKGSWWGTDPVTHRPDDIDVVCISDEDRSALIGECKFKKEPVSAEISRKLHERAHLVLPYQARYFALFSLGGFTENVKGGEDLLYTAEGLF